MSDAVVTHHPDRLRKSRAGQVVVDGLSNEFVYGQETVAVVNERFSWSKSDDAASQMKVVRLIGVGALRQVQRRGLVLGAMPDSSVTLCGRIGHHFALRF